MSHFLQQRNSRIYIDKDGKVNLPYLETYFSYGCNLRCQFCGNMSPLSSGMEKTEDIIRSMREWSQRLRPERFHISGGEPLLHPDFIELVQVAHECFPDGKVTVVTNGTLLDNISDADLQKIKNHARFKITSKHAEPPEVFERHYLRLMEMGVENFVQTDYVFRKLYDVDDTGVPIPSNSNPAAAWSRCHGNGCFSIIGDTFTYCSRIALLRRDYTLGNVGKCWYRVNGHTSMTLASTQEEILAYLHQGWHPECAVCPEKQPTVGIPKQMSVSELQCVKKRIIPRRTTPPKITAENTVFTAVGAYPDPEERCANFINSASKCGVPIQWIDWQKKWYGFNHHKLHNLQKQLRKWRKEGIEYVMCTDAKDVVYADPLHTIIAKANDVYEPGTLLFNDDIVRQVYPYKAPHFIEALMKESAPLNAGLIFGHIDTYDKVITHSLNIIDEIKNGTPRAGIATHFYHDEVERVRCIEDDQFTYQICSIYYPEYFRMDKDRYLLAWVRALRAGELLDELRREPVDNYSVGQASIIHSSFTITCAGQGTWDEWVRNNKLV